MDAISYSYADKQAKRISKFNENPDSTSGILTQPSVIQAGETVNIPAGRTAIMANTVIDGTITLGGTMFIPSGATTNDIDAQLALKASTVYVNSVTSGFPSFSATIVSQSFTAGVAAKLACATEQWDTTNNYDTSTYRFTPNKSGKYRVTVKQQSSGVNTGGAIYIYKNGVASVKLFGLNGTTVGDTFIGSYTIEMNGTTDYIEAYGLWNSTTTGIGAFQAEYIVGV